jgi:hypothetical protein
MRIKVISSKEEIPTIKHEKIVHMSFRPSSKDVFALVKTCPGLKGIHIPASYTKTISKSTLMFLEMHNITLMEGDIWGHRKDISEYYEIKPKILDKIKELKGEGKSQDEIISQLVLETRLSKDLIGFLI